MISAFLACVFSQAKVVTLDSPGWSVPQILAEVSKQTGQDFEAKDDVRNDHVIVHVDHVPIKDFMDRFGEALLSSWTTQDGAYVLQRSHELMQAESVASLARVTGAFQTDLEKLRREVSSEPPFDSARAAALAGQFKALTAPGGPVPDEEMKLCEQMPIQVALKRLLVDIGPKRLSEATQNGRAVFALNPNDFQLPLGPHSSEVIRNLLADQLVWAAANRSTEVKGGYLTSLGWNPYSNFGWCFLSITPQNGGATYSAELTLYDSDLYLLGLAQCELNVVGDSVPKQNSLPPELAKVVNIASKQEELIAPIFRRFNRDQNSSPLPSPVQALNLLTKADKIDPLSLFAGPILCEYAKQCNQNLIAYGDPNLWFGVGIAGSKGQFDPAMFWSQLVPGQVWYDSAHSWLEIRPDNFNHYLRTRWDRLALATYFSIVQQTASEPVEACADMAYRAFRPSVDEWLVATNEDVAPSIVSGFLRFNSGCQVVYGSLGAALRQAAIDGRKLLVSQLGPAPLACLKDELMGAQFELLNMAPPNAPGGKKHAYAQTVESEPTLLAGNLPGQAYISIQRSSAPGFTMANKYGKEGFLGDPEVGNAYAVAYELVQMEVTKNSDSQPSNFQPATIEKVHFEIHFSPTVVVQADFQSASALGPVVKDWKQLPEAVAKEIQADIESIQERYKQDPSMFPTQSGGGASGQP